MSEQTQSHLFCFGLGYTAHALADHLLTQGWRVSGTHRTLDACERERMHGITAHIFDDDIPLDTIWDAATITHVLVSIPPHATGDIVLRHHLSDLLQLPNLQWVGYLSTTGVYGDYQGEWVDETSPVRPASERTRKRVEVEKSWISKGLPIHIFRLAGIYGPHRNPLHKLKQGTAQRIDLPKQFFSRIHVDDIVQIITASIGLLHPTSIYNCCDDLPCSQAHVIEYAATLLGIAPPPLISLEEAHLSQMGQSFYTQNRRVRNDKIKRELGATLRYPTYKEGLASLAKETT